MTISEEDIAISMKARGKIAILEAKRQDILNKATNAISKKYDEIKDIEAQKEAALVAIDAKIQAEKDLIAALITNV